MAQFIHSLKVVNQIFLDIGDTQRLLGNSDNSAISVKGKDLPNVKMYVERIVFSKDRI